MRSVRSSSRAELRVRLCDEREAEGAVVSLAPDNEPLPQGLTISMTRDGRDLVVKVSCDRGVDSLLATLDDLLSSLNLAERTLCPRVREPGS